MGRDAEQPQEGELDNAYQGAFGVHIGELAERGSQSGAGSAAYQASTEAGRLGQGHEQGMRGRKGLGTNEGPEWEPGGWG